MAWKVEIDLENLEQRNFDLRLLLNDLRDYIDELDSLIATMQEYWEGDAAVAYINLMSRRAKEARDVYVSLAAVQNAVKTQIANLREVDNFFEIAWYQIFNN